MTNRYLRYWDHPIERASKQYKVKPCIVILGKYYSDAGQAATTLAWIVINNLFQKQRKKIPPYSCWNKMQERRIYLKARRRVLPICERILPK